MLSVLFSYHIFGEESHKHSKQIIKARLYWPFQWPLLLIRLKELCALLKRVAVFFVSGRPGNPDDLWSCRRRALLRRSRKDRKCCRCFDGDKIMRIKVFIICITCRRRKAFWKCLGLISDYEGSFFYNGTCFSGESTAPASKFNYLLTYHFISYSIQITNG